MIVKVSDLIIKYFSSLGVKEIFLVSGGGNMHLVDSVAKSKDVSYVCNHHEQACAMAAECYARATENIGVCIVTFGPAATNTLTGVAGAWLDSIPTFFISGQVRRDHLMAPGMRQLGVQEINIIDIVKPMTKYAFQVLEPLDTMYHLEKAYFLAKNGRPGPVYLDIPSDVQATVVDDSVMQRFNPREEGFETEEKDITSEISQVIDLLKEAKRPVIFAGHGIRLSKSRKELITLIEQMGIPVVTTMSAHDLLPSDHPLFSGRPGVFGDRSGNFVIQNADLLITVGSRNHLWNIGYNVDSFARAAKKVVVDIDDAELNKKTVKPDLPIKVDVKLFLKELIIHSAGWYAPIDEWREYCARLVKQYPVNLPEYKHQTEYVNSYHFTDTLSKYLNEGETIVTGVGTSFTGTLQAIKIKKDQRLHCNVGCASMGYDLPAAIGASFANNRGRVILLVGEGSIMMNIQELQTISYYKLPIKIFLLNNNGYLAIKNTQNSFFEGHLAAVDETTGLNFPDFRKVADTFGVGYLRIENHSEMEKKIQETLESSGPIICEINMSPTQPLYPKVYSEKLPDGTMVSKPLEDMYPFLEREEFKKNMFIPLWGE